MCLSLAVAGGVPVSHVTVPCRGAALVKEHEDAAPWEGAFRDASHIAMKDRTGQPSTCQTSVRGTTARGFVKCGFWFGDGGQGVARGSAFLTSFQVAPDSPPTHSWGWQDASGNTANGHLPRRLRMRAQLRAGDPALLRIR